MAFLDDMIFGLGVSPDIPLGTNMVGGQSIPNNNGRGGVRLGSHAAVVRSLQGHNQHFANNWSAVVPWTWMCAAAGHASTNTAIQIRRMGVQLLDANYNWQWLFKDSLPSYGIRKIRDDGNTAVDSIANGYATIVGDAVQMEPSGNYTFEHWPGDTPGVEFPSEAFWGAVNRGLCAQSRAKVVCVQCRLVLKNPGGTDDRAASWFGIQQGDDPHVGYQSGFRYITDGGILTDNPILGYPYVAYDGDFSHWRRITWSDWRWVGFITGVGLPGQETRTIGPPWGNYSTIPEWFLAPYQVTYQDLLDHPPLDPDGGTTEPPVEPPTPVGPPVAVVPAVWSLRSIANQYKVPTPEVTDIVGALIQVERGETLTASFTASLSTGAAAAGATVDSIVVANGALATVTGPATADGSGQVALEVTGLALGVTTVTITVAGYSESFGISVVGAGLSASSVADQASAWAKALVR